MQEEDKVFWGEDGRLEVLTFGMDGEVFAIEVALVQEVLETMPATAVPGASPLVPSVANFRGKVIPLVDLRRAYGMAPAETTQDSRVVVLQFEIAGEATLIGIQTDKVFEVAMLDRSASEPPPEVGMRWHRDHVRCVVRRPDSVVILPDIDAVLMAA